MRKELGLIVNSSIRLMVILIIISAEIGIIKSLNLAEMFKTIMGGCFIFMNSLIISVMSGPLFKVVENMFIIDEKTQGKIMLKNPSPLAIEENKNIVEKDIEHKQLVAMHEAGHAVICLYFNIPVTNVNINLDIDNNRFGEITYSYMFNTLEKMEKAIMISLAGRIAESMKYKKVSSGSSNDIFDATKLINTLIKEHGYLEKYGLLNLTIYDFEMFFEDSQILAKEFESRTKSILEEKWQLVEIIAEQLLNRKKLGKEDLEEIYSAYLESLSDKNEKNN